MRSAYSTGLMCIALVMSACNQPHEEPDFGAGIIARYVVDAEMQCAGLGFDDVAACAEASARSKARMAARTARSALKSFNSNCGEDLGELRCSELLESAYERLHPSRIVNRR